MSSKLKWVYPLLVCLLLVVGFSSNAATPLTQNASGHPSLFFNASELPAMREASTTTHADIWNPINTYATRLLSRPMASNPPGNADLNFFRTESAQVISIAFACVMTDRDDYCQLAKNRVLTHASWSVWDENDQRGLGHAHMVFSTGLAYDWLYNKLSDSERTTVRNSLLQQGERLYLAGIALNLNDPLWWSESYFQNHYYILNSSLGIAAMALMNDPLGLDCLSGNACADARVSTTPEQWLSAVGERMRLGQSILNGVADGSWHEGIPYQNYMLSFLLAFTRNYRDIAGQDVIPQTYLQNYVNWRLYNYLDNGDFIISVSDFDWDWANGYSPQAILHFISGEYNNSTAEWLVDEMVDEIGRPVGDNPWHVFEFFYYNPSVDAQAPTSMPLSYRSIDADAAIWRTGWESDAQVFGFKSGALGGRFGFTTFTNRTDPPWDPSCRSNGCQLNIGHDHEDANSFTLFRDGEWLIPENAYWGGYDADLHNSILIDGQGQYRPPANHYDLFPEDFVGTDARFETVANGSFFDYLASNATGRYRNINGLQNISRHVLYLRPDYFLILDNLAANSSHQYEAVVHFPDNITQGNRWLSATTPDGQIVGLNIVAPQNYNVSMDNSGEYPAAHIAPSTNSSNARIVYSIIPSDDATWEERPTTSVVFNDAAYSQFRVESPVANQEDYDVLIAYGQQVISNSQYLTDGSLAVIGSDNAGSVTHAALHGGTALRQMTTNRYLLANVTADATYDLEHAGTTTAVHTSKATADGAIIYAPTAASVSVNGVSVPFMRCDNYIVVGSTVPQVDYVGLTNCTLVGPTAGENLLSNSSFEAEENARLIGWTLEDSTQDKVICGKVPTVAYKGNCAFRFKTKGVPTGAKLTQVVDLTTRDTKAGDDVRLAFAYNFSNPAASVKVKCVVSYQNGSPSSKVKQSIGATSGYQDFTTDVVLSSGNASQVKVILIHKSPSGKGYIDAARLEIIRAGIPQLLPLP
jgi:hypothetical protein